MAEGEAKRGMIESGMDVITKNPIIEGANLAAAELLGTGIQGLLSIFSFL